MVNAKSLLLAGCTVLSTIPLTAANAAAPMGFAGTISGQYGFLDVGGVDGNTWGVNGEAAFGLGPNLGAQVNGGYSNVSDDFSDADVFDIGGSLFWASMQARAGGTIGYKSLDFGGGADFTATGYGAFGEFYLSDFFTLGAHGGGWSGELLGFDSDGFYFGGRGTGYITPNLAIAGTIDFLSGDADDLTTWGIEAEWQFSQATPLAVFGGYRNTSSDSGDLDAFFIGLRFYAGGAMPLVGNHRNGTLGWLGDPLRGFQF